MSKLIDFLRQILDAEETFRMTRGTSSLCMPKERLMTMDEASEEWKPMLSAIDFYVSNANAVYKRAFQAGWP
jgi:uncharacterized glyoxalase superfamily protein PhnB